MKLPRSLAFVTVTLTLLSACNDRALSGGEGEGEGAVEELDFETQEAIPCAGTWERDCETAAGRAGLEFCVIIDDEERWLECVEDSQCMPGESWADECSSSTCVVEASGRLRLRDWFNPDCNTPLVLRFDEAPLTFTPASAASFDINATGECLSTDWPTLPWLARDVDGDGEIDSGRELFGSGTRLRSGARASDGFAALAELDSDGDGKITPADPAFAELVLWSDGDDDRRGQLAELTPVSSLQLTAIHLDYAVRGECDERGNCGRERAAFEFRGPGGERRVGEVVDVHLACQ